MRRKDREVTDIQEIEAILAKSKIMHVGMFDGHRPYLVPLHFCWEKKDSSYVVYAHCAKEGRKLDILRAHPEVFFETDHDNGIVSGGDIACAYGAAFKSVMADGIARIMEKGPAKNHALELLMSQQVQRHFTITDAMADSVEVIEITLSDLTAKRRAHK